MRSPAEPDAKRQPPAGRLVEPRRAGAPDLAQPQGQPVLQLPALDLRPGLIARGHLGPEEDHANRRDARRLLLPADPQDHVGTAVTRRHVHGAVRPDDHIPQAAIRTGVQDLGDDDNIGARPG